MKKKKMLFCINELSTNSIGISFINLVNRLDYTHYDVDIIYQNANSMLLSQIPRNVNIINSPFGETKINILSKLKYFRKYDLSLMYDIGNTTLGEIVRIASKNNYVYIHKNYSGIYLVKSKYEEFIQKHKLLSYKGYLFPNSAIEQVFINNHPEKDASTHVIEYLIDDTHINALSKANIGEKKPDRSVLLTFVGSINDRAKNFSLMIKMMSDIVKINNKVKLWIIGDGPDLVNIRMMVTKNKLDEYVKLFGFKSNPYPYMALCDYYLNTADIFDASTSLIEAKVLEKPIITTNVEISDDNTYVVSSDPTLIANEVNRIILNDTKFKGKNNFWQFNQGILKKIDGLINK